MVGIHDLPLEIWAVHVLPRLENRDVPAITKVLHDLKTPQGVYHFDDNDCWVIRALATKAMERQEKEMERQEKAMAALMERQELERAAFFQYSFFPGPRTGLVLIGQVPSSLDRSRPRPRRPIL